ncbi:hypothetical protein [Legionella maioricensis]|nr:hypothetical protein [Legionella maioricensis]
MNGKTIGEFANPCRILKLNELNHLSEVSVNKINTHPNDFKVW